MMSVSMLLQDLSLSICHKPVNLPYLNVYCSGDYHLPLSTRPHLGSRGNNETKYKKCLHGHLEYSLIQQIQKLTCVSHQLPYNSEYVSRSASFPGVCKIQYEQQTHRQVLDSDDIIAAEPASRSVTEQTSQIVVLLLNFDDTSSQLTALHLRAL